MMKIYKLMMVLAISIIFSNSVFAFDRIYEKSIIDMEDLSIKENGIKINNFSFSEENAFMARGLSNIVVSFSAKNYNEVSKHFSVMIVGKSEHNILWAVSAEPMMSTISAKKTETIQGDSYISPGSLEKTSSIWLRIVGNI